MQLCGFPADSGPRQTEASPLCRLHTGSQLVGAAVCWTGEPAGMVKNAATGDLSASRHAAGWQWRTPFWCPGRTVAEKCRRPYSRTTTTSLVSWIHSAGIKTVNGRWCGLVRIEMLCSCIQTSQNRVCRHCCSIPGRLGCFRVALSVEAVRALRAAGRQHNLNGCAKASENNDYTLWFSVSELSICRGSVVFTCAADTVGNSQKDKAVRQTPARRFTTSPTLVPHRL